jgi:hypothetical protein
MTQPNQDDIDIRGPPLRIKKSPLQPLKRIPIADSDHVLQEPRRIRPRLDKPDMDNTELKNTKRRLSSSSRSSEDKTIQPSTSSFSPSNITSTPISSMILPSSFHMPIRQWCEYSTEESPMETVQSYVQDLPVLEVTIDRRKDQSTRPGISLCPFILAHLQPSNRIIPLVPLTIPSCPAYRFYLLYVLKETTLFIYEGNLTDHTAYTAVFSVFRTGHGTGYPILIGTKTNQAFVEQVRSNIQRERERARKLITEAHHVLFPLRPFGL